MKTKLVAFDVYEYPLKDENGYTYYGSYTIIAGLKPVGLPNEKLVDTFTTKIKA